MDNKLYGGVGISVITPEKPMFLVGYPHVDRISEGVHDDLMSTALCVKNDNKTVIMIAVDILAVSPMTADEIRSEIANGLEIDRNDILLSCTHTHSGPVTLEMAAWGSDSVVPAMDPEYMEFFKSQIVKSAEESYNNSEPAEFTWTTADATGVGGNRLSPDGVTDSEAGILVFRRKKDKNIFAVSVIYGMHPTVMHEDSRLISSDFPHYTREFIKKTLGKDVIIAYHTGPSGNQSPRNAVKAQTFEEAERLGGMLGERVVSSIKKLTDKDFTDKLSIDVINKIIEPVPRKFPDVETAKKQLQEYRETYERLKKDNAGHGRVRTAECAVFGAEETLVLSEAQKNGTLDATREKYKNVSVQVIRINNLCIVGLPCEIFVEYGLKIKKEASLKTFVISLANGELQGYIVTEEAAKKGGYEANNALFSYETGNKLVEAALEMINP